MAGADQLAREPRPSSERIEGEPAARGGMTPLCAGCFRTHRPKIDVAAKLGIQEKWWVLAMVIQNCSR